MIWVNFPFSKQKVTCCLVGRKWDMMKACVPKSCNILCSRCTAVSTITTNGGHQDKKSCDV